MTRQDLAKSSMLRAPELSRQFLATHQALQPQNNLVRVQMVVALAPCRDKSDQAPDETR